jgi:hypothetical protein
MRTSRVGIMSAFLAVSFACSSEDVSLRVQVLIPADVPSITSGVLRLSLWVYDPHLADAPATLTDADAALFSHRAGEPDALWMHVRGHAGGGMRHYITVQGFEVTPEGERYVLWDGIEGTAAPRTVTMQYIGAVRAEAPGRQR